MTNNKFDKPSPIEAIQQSPALSRRRISSGDLVVLMPQTLTEIKEGWNLRLVSDPLLNEPESFENENIIRKIITEREYSDFFGKVSEVEQVEGFFKDSSFKTIRHNDRTKIELSLVVGLLTESKKNFLSSLKNPKVTWAQIQAANLELGQIMGTKEETVSRRSRLIERKFDKVQDEIVEYLKGWGFPVNLTLAYLRSLVMDVAGNDLPNIDLEILRNVNDPTTLDKKNKEILFTSYNLDRENLNLLPPNTELTRHLHGGSTIDHEFVDGLSKPGDRKRILAAFLDRNDPQYVEKIVKLGRKMAITYDTRGNKLKPGRFDFERLPQDFFSILAERIEFDTLAVRVIERMVVEKTAPTYFDKHPGNKPESLKRAVTAQVLTLYEQQHDPGKRNALLKELYSLGSPFMIDDLIRRTRHASHDGAYITRPFDPAGKGADWGTAAQRAIGEIGLIARKEVGFDLNKLTSDRSATTFSGANAMEASINSAKKHYRNILEQIYATYPNLGVGLKKILFNSLNS